MNTDNLKEEILSLSTLDRDNLLKDITDSLEHNQLVERASRRHILDNKWVDAHIVYMKSMFVLEWTKARNAISASLAI